MDRDKLKKYLSFTLATLVTVAMAFSIVSYNKKHKINDLNPKIRNTDGGVFVCQNTQKNLK